MALRADQWLILGVAGLGVYALYRLSKTTHNVQTTTTGPGDQPPGTSMPPAPPGVVLPETRGRIEAPSLIPFVTGDPNAPASTMTISNSRAYRGRGEGLTEDDVAFFDVRYVYTTPEAARAAEFPEWSLTGASRNTRWFYGRYLGQDATYSRPRKIDAMWITPRPPPVGQRPDSGPVIGAVHSRIGIEAPNWTREKAAMFGVPFVDPRLQHPTTFDGRSLGSRRSVVPAAVSPSPFRTDEFGARLSAPPWPLVRRTADAPAASKFSRSSSRGRGLIGRYASGQRRTTFACPSWM